MFKAVGGSLKNRLQRVVASQDTTGKVRSILQTMLPEERHRTAITGVEFMDGTLTIRTTSKALASYLLMSSGELASALRAEGVRISRVVVR